MWAVYVPTHCPPGAPPLGDSTSASVTAVHDVDGVLRVEDLVVEVSRGVRGRSLGTLPTLRQ
jgi:hypothetical protein